MHKLLLVVCFCFLGSMMSYAQANSFDKASVMENIANLSTHTQSWIDTNFETLSDDMLEKFMNQSTVAGLRSAYSAQFDELKAKAREAEIEGFYRAPSEARLQRLFTRYGINF